MKPNGYPHAPPPREVTEARRVINEALESLANADILQIADRLRNAAAKVLLDAQVKRENAEREQAENTQRIAELNTQVTKYFHAYLRVEGGLTEALAELMLVANVMQQGKQRVTYDILLKAMRGLRDIKTDWIGTSEIQLKTDIDRCIAMGIPLPSSSPQP